ncbi:MAG: DEAD/DEAH box helicase [Sulfuricella sp.]|nr:DEAD/DEAH box helicase [Sulfuricella sp.]
MAFSLSSIDISLHFSSAYFERGLAYYQAGKVTALDIQQDGRLITALVAGSGANRYRVYIQVREQAAGRVQIDGECGCPLAFNCKHVVAALLKAQVQEIAAAPLAQTRQTPGEAPLPHEISAWLSEMARATLPAPGRDELPEDVLQRLLYVLSLSTSAVPRLEVAFFTSRLLKAGGFGKATPYYNVANALQGTVPRYFSERDREIVVALSLPRATNGRLTGARGAKLVEEMLATGRCFWKTPESAPLTLGEKRAAQPVWVMDEAGGQRLQFETTPPLRVLPLSPPWYVDEAASACGELDTGLPADIAGALAAAPLIPPQLAGRIGKELAEKLPGMMAPLPRPIREKEVADVVPIPCLRFYTLELEPVFYGSYRRQKNAAYPETLNLARLEFDYGGTRVDVLPIERAVTRRSGDELLHIVRNPVIEKAYVEQLGDLGFFFVDGYAFPNLPRKHQGTLAMGGDDDEDWIDFCLHDLPELRAAGWQVEMEPSFRFRFAEVEDWTATVDEGGGNDWFGLELGIQVDGQQVNLLPVLLDLIRRFPKEMSASSLAQLPTENSFIGHLADGRLVTLPVPRVQSILSVLVEIFDKGADANPERLELSAVQAGRLTELEDAATGLRWLGGERLRELGRRLRDFQGIQPVAPPAGLKAELRGYQQEGINWLQFLREYGLAGILADDMGLGKTVQALAHILVEKASGRMDRPCLVVAPTSLMFNWRREAERFAPELRVLVLQGLSRKQHFETIGDYDLVLTTYPLLPRDKEALTAQEFHLLILDEAHIIKNPKSQATRIVHQIKARHRLALTGTPLENHLGELWSLFHFLLPGLLGDEKEFRQLFRTPIEKHGDGARRTVLSRRIAPFLLRRTKSQVAGELPPKTEIVRSCELAGAQRDLYEAIRVAMHEKVRQEIDKKGVNRSQIVILDALLKLRQACCDPRLLKLPVAKRVEQSAKLELLMSLLPEMVEEGRRILLFSQFTSMLALIELELAKLNLPYVILTGDTIDRATPVQRFQDFEVPLFLISLKAGGVGLNLTAADTVIHYDPWWNPAVENQATDRAHRIGQENPVFVYKLVTEGTVEEKIVALQGKKRELAQGVLEGNGETGAPLSADDLTMLFEPLLGEA